MLRDELDLGVLAQPLAHHRVDDVAGAGQHRHVGLEAGHPAARGEQEHVLGHPDADHAGRDELVGDAGEELLKSLVAGGHQVVRVPRLGHAPPPAGLHAQLVTLDDRDLAQVRGQSSRCGHSGEARPDHDGVAVTAVPASGTWVEAHVCALSRALWVAWCGASASRG